MCSVRTWQPNSRASQKGLRPSRRSTIVLRSRLSFRRFLETGLSRLLTVRADPVEVGVGLSEDGVAVLLSLPGAAPDHAATEEAVLGGEDWDQALLVELGLA